jgi:hypothetical protein
MVSIRGFFLNARRCGKFVLLSLDDFSSLNAGSTYAHTPVSLRGAYPNRLQIGIKAPFG